MYDIAGARSAGLDDDYLVSHLEQSGRIPYDFARARKDGVSSTDILNAIDARQQSQRTQRQAEGAPEAGRASGMVPALGQGAADVLSGTGETLKQYTPFNSAGDMLKTAAGKIAPANYDRAHLVDEKGFHAGSIPQVAAEAAPGAAAGIAAARLAGKKFGLPGALLGGLATYYLQNVGNRAKERAAYRTGDENAEPNTSDRVTAAGATLPEAAVGGAAMTRFLPGAGRMANVGMRGVAEAGTKLATTAAVEGAAGGAQNAIAQTGRTLGTEPGFKFDPNEAANAAATGATLAPVFGATKAARDVNTSIKYHDLDPNVARRVANDIATSAEGGAEALSKTKTGFNAVNDTAKNYSTDLQTSVNALKRELGARPLPGEAEGVVRRAANGRALTERDINILENTAAGTTSGPSVVELARKINTLARLKKTGTFKDENFVGGVGHAMEKALPVLGQPVKGAAYAGLALAGASHAGLLIPSAGALGALGLSYGGARLLDWGMGTRSPAKSFVDRFAGPVPPGAPAARPGAPVPPGAPPVPPGPRPIPGFPWGTVPPTNPTGPRMRQPSTLPSVIPPAPNGTPGTINQPGPAPQPMLGGPGNGPSRPFPPPPGRGPIPQPAPNMPLLGRGPGAVIQQPQTPQLRLSPPARAQLPDVANRSVYEPEVRALLTAANAKVKTQRSADAWMQRMLGDSGEVNIDEPSTPVTKAKKAKKEKAAPIAAQEPATSNQQQKAVGSNILLRIQDGRGGASERAPYTITKLHADGSGEAHNPVSGTWQVDAKTMAAASLAEAPKSSPVPAVVRAKAKVTKAKTKASSETAAPTAAVSAAPPPPSRPPAEPTPNATVGSVKDTGSAVVQPQKTRLTSPLAARMATQHNTEVESAKRKPVETKPQVKRDKPLSMAEQLNEDAVHEAIKGGAKSPKEILSRVGEDPEDRQSLRATLNRMISEGTVSFATAAKKEAVPTLKASPVPAAVRAKVKAETPPMRFIDKAKAQIGGNTAARLVRKGFSSEAVKTVSPGAAREILVNDYSPSDASARGLVKETPKPVLTPEAPKSTVVPFKQPPAPVRDQWDAVLDAVRAKSKMPSKVEDLDADSRSRMAANKAAAERGRAALAQVQKTPEVAKRAVNEDPWEIPEALRRTKEAPKAEAPKPVLTEATRAVDKAVEAEGPPKSPHYKKGDAGATVKSAQDDFTKAKGHVLNEQAMSKAHGTIDRIIREKFDTGQAIEKEIPGFDVHDFTDRYVHTRSHAGGEQLVEFMKKKYPGHDDVFDRVLSKKAFSTIYSVRKSAADGTAKKR